jgi:hypothetical protein
MLKNYDESETTRAVKKSQKREETLEELEAEFELERLKGGNRDYSLQRLLILRLCSDRRDFSSDGKSYSSDWRNYSTERLEKIERLVSDLPDAEHTPLVCQNLMYFYAKVKFDSVYNLKLKTHIPY